MVEPIEANAQRRDLWAIGDYTVVSHHLQMVSELLCEAVELHAGTAVLDLACGNGNTALAAARRGCRVTAVDLTQSLLEHGRQRAVAECLAIDFHEEDAERLPFATATFDIVLSTFGIMFVPNRKKALGEMLRVLKPGGKIGLANWWSGTKLAHTAILARYSTARPPNPWMLEEGVRELLGKTVNPLCIRVREVMYRFPSAAHYVEAMRQRFPTWCQIFAGLDPETAEQLKHELVAECERHNRSDDASLVLPKEYLEIVAVKQ
jgi:ubiquinone/menaquinone biosynthesis C-methylase UbiE